MHISSPPLVASLAAVVLSLPGCVVVSGDMNPFASSVQPLEERRVSGSGRPRIVLLDVAGEITSESSEAPFGLQVYESTVSRVEAALEMAADDDDVAALILRINSPGGTVTASDVLYEKIRRFKEESAVPVIAEVVDVGASGAYYAALAADEIVAHPTSIVGSVGVILESISLAGLMQKVGVRNQAVATGEMKDIGSPLSEMSDAEREVLQGIVDDMYDRFLELVHANRPNLTPEADRQLRDGRIFTARQALAGGLIDRIEYLDETVERVKKEAGLSEATVVVYRESGEFARGLYSRAGAAAPQASLINIDGGLPKTPRLLYLWNP